MGCLDKILGERRQAPQMSLKVRVSKILKIHFLDAYSLRESFKDSSRQMGTRQQLQLLRKELHMV